MIKLEYAFYFLCLAVVTELINEKCYRSDKRFCKQKEVYNKSWKLTWLKSALLNRYYKAMN